MIEYAREEGLREVRQQQDVMYIKNGLQAGLSLEMISDLTSLSIEKIKKIITEQGLEMK